MNEQRYQLFVKKGPEPGEIYDLSSVSMTIGRDPLSEITINDPEVSRRHARLIGTLSGYRIQDLGSTNGTFVNGVRLSGEPIDLEPGQIISIGGGVELVYQPSGDVKDQSETIIETDAASLEPATQEFSEIVAEHEIVEDKSEPESVGDSDMGDDEFGIEGVAEEVGAEAEEDADSDTMLGDDLIAPETILEPQQSEAEEQPPPISDQADDYVPEKVSEPVVIPHEGEPVYPQQDSEKSRFRRASTVIAALILLIICCCCSFLLFLWFYGGDWLLRQIGLLP